MINFAARNHFYISIINFQLSIITAYENDKNAK